MKRLLIIILAILFSLPLIKAQTRVVHSSSSYVITNGVGTKYEKSVTISFKTGGFIIKVLNDDPIEFFFTKFIQEKVGCYYGEVITIIGEKYYFWLSHNELTWSSDPKNRNGIQYLFDKN